MSEPTSLAAAVEARPDKPTLESFLDYMVVELGGMRAVARLVAQELLAAKSGSLMRTRLVEMVMRSFRRTDTDNPTDHEHLLSDDDLRRYMEERERTILQGIASDGRPARPDQTGPAPQAEAAPPVPAATPAAASPPTAAATAG